MYDTHSILHHATALAAGRREEGSNTLPTAAQCLHASYIAHALSSSNRAPAPASDSARTKKTLNSHRTRPFSSREGWVWARDYVISGWGPENILSSVTSGTLLTLEWLAPVKSTMNSLKLLPYYKSVRMPSFNNYYYEVTAHTVLLITFHATPFCNLQLQRAQRREEVAHNQHS